MKQTLVHSIERFFVGPHRVGHEIMVSWFPVGKFIRIILSKLPDLGEALGRWELLSINIEPICIGPHC